jgi:hypothetical protein
VKEIKEGERGRGREKRDKGKKEGRKESSLLFKEGRMEEGRKEESWGLCNVIL